MSRASMLILEDKTQLTGKSFGAETDASGEVVFNTGMVGYPEALTDPSYRGQILVLTYPLIGNYGVSQKGSEPRRGSEPFHHTFESDKIQIAGLVVSEYCAQYSHPQAMRSLSEWLKSENIPAIEGIDTRALTEKLREKGTMLGKITNYKLQITNKFQILNVKCQNFINPNERNLAAEVSCQEPIIYEPKIPNSKFQIPNSILLYDCGVKLNIIRSLLKRGYRVIRVSWNYSLDHLFHVSCFMFHEYKIDGIVISNGPGDPTKCDKTIEQIKFAMRNSQLSNSPIPILGICLGNQILALAAGAKTYKLKYGHRGQNQPVIENLESGIWNLEKNPKNKILNSKFPARLATRNVAGRHILNSAKKAFITSQNHGFAVDEKTLPANWNIWFKNLNDGTVEGIMHRERPWMAVQFHPEAAPGPTDTEWIFDKWLSLLP